MKGTVRERAEERGDTNVDARDDTVDGGVGIDVGQFEQHAQVERHRVNLGDHCHQTNAVVALQDGRHRETHQHLPKTQQPYLISLYNYTYVYNYNYVS